MDEPGEMKNNIVALFGIPKFRVRTVSVVADTAGSPGRRLGVGTKKTSTFELNTVHPCDDMECGRGECEVDDEGHTRYHSGSSNYSLAQKWAYRPANNHSAQRMLRIAPCNSSDPPVAS